MALTFLKNYFNTRSAENTNLLFVVDAAAAAPQKKIYIYLSVCLNVDCIYVAGSVNARDHNVIFSCVYLNNTMVARYIVAVLFRIRYISPVCSFTYT